MPHTCICFSLSGLLSQAFALSSMLLVLVLGTHALLFAVCCFMRAAT
jgi:hypothetical protein